MTLGLLLVLVHKTLYVSTNLTKVQVHVLQGLNSHMVRVRVKHVPYGLNSHMAHVWLYSFAIKAALAKTIISK